MDIRHYQRFGLPGWQFNPEIAWEFHEPWVARVNAGIASQGDFIPRWRVGAGLDYYAPSGASPSIGRFSRSIGLSRTTRSMRTRSG
jgi:hypothetical protein